MPDSAEPKDAIGSVVDRLRAQQPRQGKPSAVRPAQPRGGAPAGTLTDQLSTEQRGAIGEKVRECWTKDAGALELEKMSAQLVVITDAAGVVHEAHVGPEDQGRMTDPRFRAFAERAVRAVMDARCATLPLPRDKLGARNELVFRFRP